MNRCLLLSLALGAALVRHGRLRRTWDTPDPGQTPGTIATPPAGATSEQPASPYSASGSMAFATLFPSRGSTTATASRCSSPRSIWAPALSASSSG